MGWMCRRIWGSLSIGPRISTYWWSVGRSGSRLTGCSQYGRIVVGGVPTLRVEEWLASDWVREVDDHQLLDVVLLDDVERLSVM